MSDKTEGPSISSTIRQWLDKSHQFIDTHPRTVKGKFIKHGREIPSRFITKGIDLQGTVKEVHAEGLIYVQHIPILKLRLPSGRVLLPKNLVFVDLTSTGSRDWLKQNLLNKHVWFQVLKVEAENDHLLQTTVYSQKVTMETTLLERVRELLPMTLAFVDLTSTGSRDWLKQNLLNKHVWFQVLTVEAENDHLLQTAVYSQKFLLWKTCVNDRLITDGLCKVMAVPGEDLKNLTMKQSELLNRMISLERKSDKKGRGIWKEEKPSFKQTLKNWLIAFYYKAKSSSYAELIKELRNQLDFERKVEKRKVYARALSTPYGATGKSTETRFTFETDKTK